MYSFRSITRNCSVKWARISLNRVSNSRTISEDSFSGLDISHGNLLLRVFCVNLKIVSEFPEDFRMFTPGLETYFACRYACKNNVQKVYGGNAFDPITVENLRNEPDMYAHTLLWNSVFKSIALSSSWTSQYDDWINTLHVRGGEAFAESIDRSRINFMVAMLNRVAPKQKKILVDKRDDRIFNQLYNMKDSKNIVAVVNQWHMEGIETHWRRLTGTVE